MKKTLKLKAVASDEEIEITIKLNDKCIPDWNASKRKHAEEQMDKIHKEVYYALFRRGYMPSMIRRIK